MTKTLNVIYGSTKNKKIAVTPTDYNGMLNIHHYLKNDEMNDIRDFLYFSNKSSNFTCYISDSVHCQ